MKGINNLDRIVNESNKSGIIGNEGMKKHILLACISTLNLDYRNTINIVVEGEAGTGKTATVKSILNMFPEEKKIERSRLSKRALDHMEGTIDGKIFFIEELSGNEGTYSTKIVISEGILKIDVVQNKNGQHETKTKELSAKGTSFITTTTQRPQDLELESRVIRIYPDVSDEHRSRVLKAIMNRAKNPINKDVDHCDKSALKTELGELNNYHVSVPYSEIFVSENIMRMPNAYRNSNKIVAFIQANTLLNQSQREQNDNTLIATEEDYMSVKDLLEELINPPTPDRIKLESSLDSDEFTARDIMEIYGVEKSEAYSKIHRFQKISLVREIGRGKYKIIKTLLPSLEITPVIPAVLGYGDSGHSGGSTELDNESQHTAKVAETPESVEKENSRCIKIEHMMKFDVRMLDFSSATTA